MAKRKTTKQPVEPTLEPTYDITEESVSPVVEAANEIKVETVTIVEEVPVVEVEAEEAPVVETIEEVEVEAEAEVEETIEETIEEIVVEETPAVEVVKKSKTAKEMFLDSISKTPFTIYQNGILVCNYSAFLNIKVEEKYFEINNKKYSYAGIEIKHA